MLADGSVKVNRIMALEDVYLTPGTLVLTYLNPKVYTAAANVLPGYTEYNHWRPRWKLVRMITDHWVIVDKPAGLSSIPSRDFARASMTPYWLRKSLHRNDGSAGVLTTSRLDVGTHGLLVVGRNDQYVKKHNIIIENRKITKKYTAVVMGWTRPVLRKKWTKSKLENYDNLIAQWQLHINDKNETNSKTEGYLENMKEPYRHLGLWNHFIPLRGLENGDICDPSYGESSFLVDRIHDTDHLRVISTRVAVGSNKVPVSLILEAARPLIPTKALEENFHSGMDCTPLGDQYQNPVSDSVALRPFNQKWRHRLIEICYQAGEPLYELDIELLTGKTHQIRTQLEAEGLVIIGDWLYGSSYLPEPNSFALCCRYLSWTCPVENRLISYDLRKEKWLEDTHPGAHPISGGNCENSL